MFNYLKKKKEISFILFNFKSYPKNFFFFFCLIYFFANNIHISESCHITAKKENYQNYEFNEVLDKSIYDSKQKDIGHVAKGSNKDNTYKTFNIKDTIKTKGIPNHLETHNILNNQPGHIQIHHKIPRIDTEDFIEFSDLLIQPPHPNKPINRMYNQLYNEYPPMNGVGCYNHNINANKESYTTNMYNNNVSDFTFQQRNVHGENDLTFTDGNTYGFFDQSNFTGKNTFVCGANQNSTNHIPRRNMTYGYPIHNYPMNPNMTMNYPIIPISHERNDNKKLALPFNHQYNYNDHHASPITPQKNKELGHGKVHKKEVSRKNVSKVKRGAIDINIETSTSGRQGLTLDVNIDVRN